MYSVQKKGVYNTKDFPTYLSLHEMMGFFFSFPTISRSKLSGILFYDHLEDNFDGMY